MSKKHTHETEIKFSFLSQQCHFHMAHSPFEVGCVYVLNEIDWHLCPRWNFKMYQKSIFMSRSKISRKPLPYPKRSKLHMLADCSFSLLHQLRQRKLCNQVGQLDGLDGEKQWFHQAEAQSYCSNTSLRWLLQHFGHRLIGCRVHSIGRAAAGTFWQMLMVSTRTVILSSMCTFFDNEEMTRLLQDKS